MPMRQLTAAAPVGLWCLVGLLAMGAPRWAFAQAERSGGGGANAQLMQQYQQAQAESARLQAENTKLKSDLDAAQKQLKAAQQALTGARASQSSAHQAELSALQNARDANTKSLEDMKRRTQEIVDKYRELAGTLKTVETERSDLKQQIAARNAAYDTCAQRNVDLFTLNNEILDRAAHRGGVNRVALDEPFTRIAHNRMDNLITEYRERAEQLRLQRTAAPAGSGTH